MNKKILRHIYFKIAEMSFKAMTLLLAVVLVSAMVEEDNSDIHAQLRRLTKKVDQLVAKFDEGKISSFFKKLKQVLLNDP